MLRWNDPKTGRAYSLQRVFTEHLDGVKRRLAGRTARFRERLEDCDGVRVISAPHIQIRTAFGTRTLIDERVRWRVE